jgi:hypothetical protein
MAVLLEIVPFDITKASKVDASIMHASPGENTSSTGRAKRAALRTPI